MPTPSRDPGQKREPLTPIPSANVFSVDVEDYFQVSAFEKYVPRSVWGQWESRVAGNTRRLLAILERHDVRATFFVLGWVGDHYPRLVRAIQAAGHEIGSHGYWHRLVCSQTPQEFREDLRRSRKALEAATGQQVTCYRAPKFSIDRRTQWALDILAEEGFAADASVCPRDNVGHPFRDIDLNIHRLATRAGPIWEFPVSRIRIAGVAAPVGGGYFRLVPWSWMAARLRQFGREGRPFMFFIHPWEIDPAQPRIPRVSGMAKLRHYINLAGTEQKLEKLLSHFRFGRLCDAIAAAAHTMELDRLEGDRELPFRRGLRQNLENGD